MLRVLALTDHCHHCYFSWLANLRFYQTVLLTAAFLFVTIAVGIYNDDARKEFSIFFNRFIIAAQLIMLPAWGAAIWKLPTPSDVVVVATSVAGRAGS